MKLKKEHDWTRTRRVLATLGHYPSLLLQHKQLLPNFSLLCTIRSNGKSIFRPTHRLTTPPGTKLSVLNIRSAHSSPSFSRSHPLQVVLASLSSQICLCINRVKSPVTIIASVRGVLSRSALKFVQRLSTPKNNSVRGRSA